MLANLGAAFRAGDLRRRILYTLWMLFIFRVGAHIPVPGINNAEIARLFEQGALFGLLDLFSGGALKAFSVFAMSIGPYITSSIIVQLLTIVIPAWERMAKEGEEGRRKLNSYTRYGTVVLGLIQAAGMAYGLRTAILDPSVWSITLIALTLTAGTAFLMWLGEQITEKGIGNGISLLIFAGIVSRLPGGVGRTFMLLRGGAISAWNLLILVVLGVLVIAAVVYTQEAERRVPIQYAKQVRGRRMYGGQSTMLPLKINAAGVIPVIFSTSVLAFPVTIAQFIDKPWAKALTSALGFTTPLYMAANFLLIIFFTYFYTAIQFNPLDVAENLKKYGGFIPGIRPGRPTAEFLDRILTRITLAGAFFLGVIAVLPSVFWRVVDMPGLYFGGTALLIIVGVALETMKQVEMHLIMRQYQGFIK